MCSEFEKQLNVQAEEDEGEISELSTSPHSYPVYNHRFTFNKKQKSSLGRNRSNRFGTSSSSSTSTDQSNKGEKSNNASQYAGLFAAKTPTSKGAGLSWMRETPVESTTPLNHRPKHALWPANDMENDSKSANSNFNKHSTNVSAFDSGLDISYPSSLFSNSKSERITSIFNSNTCKKNIYYNTPYKTSEDKENILHLSENNCSSQQSKPELFSYKTKTDAENIVERQDVPSLTEIESRNNFLDIQPKRVTLFRPKSNNIDNTPHVKPTQEFKEPDSKPTFRESQPHVTLFNTKLNPFENKIPNFNMRQIKESSVTEIETKSHMNNHRVTLFDCKSKIGDKLNRLEADSKQDLIKTDLQDKPMAYKKTFYKPFVFTAGSQPINDKIDTVDDVNAPLDLSTGDHLYKSLFNNTESSTKSSESSIAFNSSGNNVADDLSKTNDINDSGINISELDKNNTNENRCESNLYHSAYSKIRLPNAESKCIDIKNPSSSLENKNSHGNDKLAEAPTKPEDSSAGDAVQHAVVLNEENMPSSKSEHLNLKTHIHVSQPYSLNTNKNNSKEDVKQSNLELLQHKTNDSGGQHYQHPMLQTHPLPVAVHPPPDSRSQIVTGNNNNTNVPLLQTPPTVDSQMEGVTPRLSSCKEFNQNVPSTSVAHLNIVNKGTQNSVNKGSSINNHDNIQTTELNKVDVAVNSSPSSMENHNLLGKSSVLQMPSMKPPSSIDLLTNNDALHYQEVNLHQQLSNYQQPAHMNGLLKPMLPTPNFAMQESQENRPTKVVNPAGSNSLQSFHANCVDFIKPSNPAPKLGFRLPIVKNKQNQVKPVSNVQNNFAISSGILTRLNDCLYVNGKAYTILSTLGRGGSSEVYQVIDPNTSTLMAVKCVNLSMVDQSIADGYLNEIDLLRRLQGCTTVIKMFDYEFVVESKMLYVVMEKGDTDLSKLIRDICKTTKISMSMIIYYWTEMLTAVRDIHDKGIIHSDLKPANFLLVSGRLKLIDFGIASSLQGDMTSVMKDVATGTWNYMSPEALRNSGGSGLCFKITYRSDVWSLGCILYNLIYGKTPFSHIAHTWSKLQAITDPNHRIDFPALNIPPVLYQALKSCFHRDPKQRPTVAQLLELPYHTTVDQRISLGLQVKSIIHEECYTKIQHLFEDKKPDDTTETTMSRT